MAGTEFLLNEVLNQDINKLFQVITVGPIPTIESSIPIGEQVGNFSEGTAVVGITFYNIPQFDTKDGDRRLNVFMINKIIIELQFTRAQLTRI